MINSASSRAIAACASKYQSDKCLQTEKSMRWNTLSEVYELGLNVLQRMISKGFDSHACDELECMAFNVNLDLAVRLFEKYTFLKRIEFWSNTEKITYSSKNKERVLELIDKGQIAFFHIPEDTNIVHGKIYVFKKDGAIQFAAIGSPNFSDGSNQNFESLAYIYDKSVCDEILEKIPKTYEDLNLVPMQDAPIQLYHTQVSQVAIDPKLFEGLWEHQKAILNWLVNRQLSIVDIPPGTGKTDIAFAYLRYLFELDQSLTAIVLVPTTYLIKQWMGRLEAIGIESSEWGTDLADLGGYFASPDHRVLVTLYDRFWDQYRDYQKRARILKPNILLILDECHNTYGRIYDLGEFMKMADLNGSKLYVTGLSATIDSFRVWDVTDFINLMGGRQNRFNISLQSFYSHWNHLNQPNPVLKPIRYNPIEYRLNNPEMEKLKEFSKKVAIEMNRSTIIGERDSTAAIQRARWLRGLPGGLDSLKNYITTHMDGFAGNATIIFVQTNEMAEDLQAFITHQYGWNPESSIYVYDSAHDEEYRSHAMTQFKKHRGFCLISEKLLSEGFDLPKVDKVILHGSDKSPRDWIQKIGRAIRFDRNDPGSIAEVADVIFCETNGVPLPLERERFECLKSISV